MAIKIITGFTDSKHITPADDAGLYRGMFGDEDYVLSSGSQLKATAVSATEISIADGEFVMQGRFARNDTSYASVPIANGTVGMKRKDLIVARYEKNSATSIESITLVAITGEATSGTAQDPAYTVGDIENGEVREFPLYRVRLNGLNIEGIDKMFTVAKSSTAMKAYVDETEAELETKLQKNIDGKAASSHNHSASAITSGTLSSDRLPTVPIAKGGTGATSVAGARKELGLGNTSGALPIANGGTGATSVAAARNALGLGNTSGALPIANGGTGTTNANGIRKALELGDGKTLGPLGVPYGGTGATSASGARMALGISPKVAIVSSCNIVDSANNQYGTSDVAYNESCVLSVGATEFVFLNSRITIPAKKLAVPETKFIKIGTLGAGAPSIRAALSVSSSLDDAERLFMGYIETDGEIWVKMSTRLAINVTITISVTGAWANF